MIRVALTEAQRAEIRDWVHAPGVTPRVRDRLIDVVENAGIPATGVVVGRRPELLRKRVDRFRMRIGKEQGRIARDFTGPARLMSATNRPTSPPSSLPMP